MSDSVHLTVAEQAANSLEAARQEVERRMRRFGLPSSLTVNHPTIIPREDLSGWTSSFESIQVSGLHDDGVILAIRDDSVDMAVLGLREQLEPLAIALDSTTDLGAPRTSGVFPGLTGVEGVLHRCVIPFALTYLRRLSDLSVPDEALVQKLVGELEALRQATRTTHVRQLAITGALASVELDYRGVRLRPLTELERGAVSQRNISALRPSSIVQSEFVIPSSFNHFIPSALLETRCGRASDGREDTSALIRPVVLSFFLHDFDLSSSGLVVNYDEPQWLAQGYYNEPFEVATKLGPLDRTLSDAEFKVVVDLAHKIPPFTASETNRREIVLDRALRGCGAQHAGAGFLDFVIALEGALLGGVKLELAYKFSLYGALFLRDERDPTETFAKLKAIYQARSDLVHGSPPQAKIRDEAFKNAGEIARAVVRRSIEAGWPDGKVLDRLALDGEKPS